MALFKDVSLSVGMGWILFKDNPVSVEDELVAVVFELSLVTGEMPNEWLVL